MFNGDNSQSLDRNHSLSLFYSRRTPSKSKPIKKQSKFSLPTGEYLSPAKVNTPYNSTTTPVLVHSLSDMSLKNEDANDERSALEDSPTPAGRYSKILTKSNTISIENTIPLYPSQKLKTKSNSTSKIESLQHQMSLPSFQRKSRMSSLMIERKPVNLFSNFSQEEKDSLDESFLNSKNEDTYLNEKNQMSLDEQVNELDGCPCSNGFLNDDGIWEDPTLSQSESRCLQTTVGNIMTNIDYDDMKDQLDSNDKTLMWEFEDNNKFNDKENIIPDDYKGGVLAEREWCDLNIDEDSAMDEYDNPNDEFLGSSSQTKSILQKGKQSGSGMIKKSEYKQHLRYAFQEISINSMPEYQMGLCDCISVYSNSSFGSACDSQKMATPKKCSSYKISNSFSKSNDFSNSFNNNNNIDTSDSVPSFFNTQPLIKSLKSNASTSSIRKQSYSKKLVYQLCGVPDLNAVHKKSISRSRLSEKKNIEGEMILNNTSYMNSSPIISKSSILSPPFLLSSPVVRNGFSSPLVQTTNNYSFNISNESSTDSSDPFTKKDTNDSLNEKTPKPLKVKSLLTTSINNSLSSTDGENSKLLENTNTSKSKTILNDTNCDFEDKEKIESEKITPKPGQIHRDISIPDNSSASSEIDHSQTPKDTVFFPHYHSRQHSQIENDDNTSTEKKKELDDSLIDQTSNMMSISPSTLLKINKTHQSFLQSNPILDSTLNESPSSINLPKRGRISVEDKKKELNNRRRARLKKYVF